MLSRLEHHLKPASTSLTIQVRHSSNCAKRQRGNRGFRASRKPHTSCAGLCKAVQRTARGKALSIQLTNH